MKDKVKKVGLNLTEGPILQTLLLFSVPLILTNLVQQLYSIVDLMVIGKFAGNTGTVGVSIGGEVSDLLTPLATAFASAGQVYISQLVGAGDHKRVKETIGTLLTLMLAASCLFVVATLCGCRWILNLLNCPPEAFSQASSYLLVTTAGFPFIFGYNAVCGALRGMGESKRPLLFISIAATLNIFMDLLLVAVFHMGAAGTAIATVIAQIGSCAAAFVFLYHRREQFGFELRPSYFKINRSVLRIILMLGIPKMIQSTCIRFSLLWCNANINGYGLVASAANSVGNKIQKLCTVFVSAVDTGAGAMIGQNLGAKKHGRVQKTVWTAFGCTLAAATAASALALFAPRFLYGFFTNDAAVLDMGVDYMKIQVITFYLAACLGTFQSLVTGSGFAAFSFVIGMLDGVVCRIGFSVLFAYGMHMGLYGFFYGSALGRSIPAAMCFLYFISGKWRTRKLLVESETDGEEPERSAAAQ